MRKSKDQLSSETLEDDSEENFNSDEEDEDDTSERGNKRRLSMKDTGVILSISVILTFSLLATTVGMEEIIKKLTQDDTWDLVFRLSFLIVVFSLVSYLLVKVAAHYFVYLAIATFCAIIFPVSRRRQRRAVKEIYLKAEKRGKND